MNSLKSTMMMIVLTAYVFLASSGVKADTVTLSVGGGAPRAASYYVPSNVVAQIVFAELSNAGNNNLTANILVSFPPATNQLYYTGAPNPPLMFAGPATVTLTNFAYFPVLAICTIQTSAASVISFAPSSSVVIPNDSGGAVTIMLESSTDLINWTAANPGTYGTSSTNRFFRVRAQR